MKTPQQHNDIEKVMLDVFEPVMEDVCKRHRITDTFSDTLSDSLSEHLLKALTTLTDKVREEEREMIFKIASEHRVVAEGEYARGRNEVVKAIWEALGAVKDERGAYMLPPLTPKKDV